MELNIADLVLAIGVAQPLVGEIDGLRDGFILVTDVNAALEPAMLKGSAAEDQVRIAAGLAAGFKRGGVLRFEHLANLAGTARDVVHDLRGLPEVPLMPAVEAACELEANLLVVRRDDDERARRPSTCAGMRRIDRRGVSAAY